MNVSTLAGPSARFPFLDVSGVFARPLGWLVSLAALATLSPGVARAQLTVEGLTGTAVTEKGPYYRDVEDAIKKFAARDIDGTRALLAEAKKKSPKLAPPEVMLAQMFLQISQPNPARAELEKAVKNWPNDPEAYAIMGEFALNEGRTEESRLLYLKTLSLLKKFTENEKRKKAIQSRAYATIAAVEEDRGHLDQAATSNKEWVDADPESAAAHQRYGRALFLAGHPEAAEKEFKKMNELDPKFPTAEISMATLYRQKKDTEKADEQIKNAAKALKTHDNLAARLQVAQWFLQSGEIKQAVEHSQAALKLDPHNAEARVTLGLIARIEKHNDTAEKYFTDAHLAAPTNFGAINNLAQLLIDKDDEAEKKRARDFAELNARLNSSNTEALATLAWIDFRLNRTAEAERAFASVLQAVTQANASTPDISYFLACAFKDQKPMTEKLIQLLSSTLDSGKAFAYRDESRALLEVLKERTAAPAKGGKTSEKESSGKGSASKRPSTAKANP